MWLPVPSLSGCRYYLSHVLVINLPVQRQQSNQLAYQLCLSLPLTHTHTHTYTHELIKQVTGTASTNTGWQEVTAMSQEIGYVFFRGCSIPVIRRSRLSCLFALHTYKTHVQRHTHEDTHTHMKTHAHTHTHTHTHPGRHIRETDRRWSYDMNPNTHTRTHTHTHMQINTLSLIFLRGFLFSVCLEQQRRKRLGERGWLLPPVMSTTVVPQLSETHTYAQTHPRTDNIWMQGWCCKTYRLIWKTLWFICSVSPSHSSQKPAVFILDCIFNIFSPSFLQFFYIGFWPFALKWCENEYISTVNSCTIRPKC